MLNYYLTATDLEDTNFKWSKVLQLDYNSPNGARVAGLFGGSRRKVISKYKSGNIDIIECNAKIRDIVTSLESKFPEDFRGKRGELGYYSATLLGKLYLQGLVTITHNAKEIFEAKIQEEKETQEQQKALAKEIAQAKEIEKQLEEAHTLARQEANRIPVIVGMRFPSKKMLIKAYLELLPEGTKTSKQWEEVNKLLVVEQVPHETYSKCLEWIVRDIIVEGGRKWLGCYSWKE
jgi:hypothetical protein